MLDCKLSQKVFTYLVEFQKLENVLRRLGGKQANHQIYIKIRYHMLYFL